MIIQGQNSASFERELLELLTVSTSQDIDIGDSINGMELYFVLKRSRQAVSELALDSLAKANDNNSDNMIDKGENNSVTQIEAGLNLVKEIEIKIVEQLTSRLEAEIPLRHPDDNIQLLSELLSLEPFVESYLESLSATTFRNLTKLTNKFEKNVITYFNVISQTKGLFKITQKLGPYFRDKFLFKIYEIYHKSKHTVHPGNIIRLLIALHRRSNLDRTTVNNFVDIFNQEVSLSTMSHHELIGLLELDIAYNLLAKDSFAWIVANKGEDIVSIKHLPELVDLFIALKLNTLESYSVGLELKISELIENSLQSVTTNKEIPNHTEIISLGMIENYNEEALLERFGRIMLVYKREELQIKTFHFKFEKVIRLLVSVLKVNGMSSAERELAINHDVLCLGSGYADLVYEFEE